MVDSVSRGVGPTIIPQNQGAQASTRSTQEPVSTQPPEGTALKPTLKEFSNLGQQALKAAGDKGSAASGKLLSYDRTLSMLSGDVNFINAKGTVDVANQVSGGRLSALNKPAAVLLTGERINNMVENPSPENAKLLLQSTKGTVDAVTTTAKGIVSAANNGSALAKATVSVAGDVALRTGLQTAGKAAGRFVPGMNVAMAGVDTAIAANDIRKAVENPSARNIAKAAFGSITAAGSIAAASNVPVVSQIGAGVAIAGDIAKAAVDVDWQAAGRTAARVATQATQTVTRAATQATQTVTRAATQARQTVSRAATQATQTVTRAATQARETVSRAASQATQQVSQAASRAYNKGTAMLSSAASAISSWWN